MKNTLISSCLFLTTFVASANAQSAPPLSITAQSMAENLQTRAWVAQYFVGTRSGSAATWAAVFAEDASYGSTARNIA
jgi:hypothetical protein